MKPQAMVYVHVEHKNILAFREEADGIYIHTLQAETIPGLVYTSIPDWYPIASIKVDANNQNQVLDGYIGRVTHKVDLELLAKQFPGFNRSEDGRCLMQPVAPERMLQLVSNLANYQTVLGSAT